jgi:hypothetical protein
VVRVARERGPHRRGRVGVVRDHRPDPVHEQPLRKGRTNRRTSRSTAGVLGGATGPAGRLAEEEAGGGVAVRDAERRPGGVERHGEEGERVARRAGGGPRPPVGALGGRHRRDARVHRARTSAGESRTTKWRSAPRHRETAAASEAGSLA